MPARSLEPTVTKNIDLLGAYAELLTLDTALAWALLRETLSRELFHRIEPGWLASRTAALGCMRAIFQGHYQARGLGPGEPPDLLAGTGSHWILQGPLGRALCSLPIEDRELLFLRYVADLEPAELGRLVRREPAAVAARLEALCRSTAFDRSFRALPEAPPNARARRAHAELQAHA